MPEFPYIGGGVIRTVPTPSGSTSTATQLTSNASANTMGTPVVLTESTEFDASWVYLSFTDASAQARFMVDLMIGASTEQVIIPFLAFRSRGAGGCGPTYLFPVFIPKGSRLAARCQDSTGGLTMRISVTLVAGTLLASGAPPSWVEHYGATASTQGTNIDPGATPNTDVTTEITASTTRAHHWLSGYVMCGDQALAATTYWRVSIRIGAATEAVLIPDLHFSADLTSDEPHHASFNLPVFIPAGSRLTATVRSSTGTDADRDVYIKLYGAG